MGNRAGGGGALRGLLDRFKAMSDLKAQNEAGEDAAVARLPEELADKEVLREQVRQAMIVASLDLKPDPEAGQVQARPQTLPTRSRFRGRDSVSSSYQPLRGDPHGRKCRPDKTRAPSRVRAPHSCRLEFPIP